MRTDTVSTTDWEDRDTLLTRRIDWWAENGDVQAHPGYRAFVEASLKFQALVMLLDDTGWVSRPTREERTGLALLERDEQLPPKRQRRRR